MLALSPCWTVAGFYQESVKSGQMDETLTRLKVVRHMGRYKPQMERKNILKVNIM